MQRSLRSPSPPLSPSPLSSYPPLSPSPTKATRVRCRRSSLSAAARARRHRSSPSAAAAAHRLSSSAPRRLSSSAPCRRSPRLAAQVRISSAEDRDPAGHSSPAEDSDPADRFGLAGLIVLPIPDIQSIAATISSHAQELIKGNSTQEALVYHSATASHIDALGRGDSIYPGRITFFGNESGLLYFRMPTPVHEAAHLLLFHEIRDLIVHMGLKHAIQATGSSTYKGTGSKKKEGDSGIRPDPPRWTGDHFPTLVIEAGSSESLRLLHKDKDWWFDNSPPGQPRGDVRVVLLIKVEHQRRRIFVEQWYRGQQSPSHTVVIMPHSDKPLALYDASHWVVENAPMIIPFEDVFLRLPTWPRTRNLVLTEPFFINLGMQCWRSHTRLGDA